MEASKIVRKGVVLFFVTAVLYYIFLLLFLPGTKALISAIFPEKDPPNPIFSTLPPLQFIEKKAKGEFNPAYKLDTNDGRLPKGLPKKMTVYEIRKNVPSFEKGKDARDTALELGYLDDDLITSLKEPIYKWRKLSSNGLLEINTDNRHLTLETPLGGKASFFPRGGLTEKKALDYARDIFKKIGRFDDKLYLDGSAEVILGQFSGSALKETKAESDAQIARVDFFRRINDTPIFGPDPLVGMLYAFVRAPKKEDAHYNVPIMEGYLWEIVPDSQASYPIIGVDVAWEHLKQNKAVVVSILPDSTGKLVAYTPVVVEQVFINNIFLAYYESIDDQPYLQPVYVFQGKYTTSGTQGGTIALYYPAVSPEFIKTN